MIWIGGTRAGDPRGDPGPETHLFLPGETQAAGPRAAGPARAALDAAAAAGPALVWGGPDTVTVLAHDGAAVTRDVTFASGLTIPAGAPIALGEDAVEVDAGGEAGRVRISLAAPDAGTVTHASPGFDVWIRYFFPAGPAGPSALGAVRYRVLASTGPLAVQLDPARPFDPDASHAVPAAAAPPRPSTFRTRWGAALALAPRGGAYVFAHDPERNASYATLNGTWDVTLIDSDVADVELVPGTSGAEYVQTPRTGAALRFCSTGPAYAAGFSPTGGTGLAAPVDLAAPPLPLTATVPGVAPPVTTAWAYPQGTAAGYYSQPDLGGLFRPDPQGSLLWSLAIEAAPLPGDATSPYVRPASFPAVPYAGLEAGLPAAVVARFDAEVLTPARAQVIAALGPTPEASTGPADPTPPAGPASLTAPVTAAPLGVSAPTGPTGPVTTAVTPQGLLSTFSRDLVEWRRLELARSPAGGNSLVLTDVQAALREALLSNRLFLVVTDVDRLRDCCSTTYLVTAEVLTLAAERKIAPEAIRAVRSLTGLVYATAGYFEAALTQVLQGQHPDAQAFFLEYAELAQLTVGDWTFDLAAHRWKHPTAPTMLIIKFAEGDVASLLADRSRWTLPSAFNAGDGTQAQHALQTIVDEARTALPTEPDLGYFVDTVLGESTQPPSAWNGVLFLNPAVPADAFPPDLGALAAGLPEGPLRAHHLGVTLSSFALGGGQVALTDSSVFGLILYTDATDLVYSGSAYAFKVLSLKVRFANSAVAAFSSQVELLVGQLFNELSTLEGSLRGDNVIFDGTLEGGAYRFTSVTLNHFTVASEVLAHVDVASAQFVTVVADSTAQRTVARFVFQGALGFRALAGADLFGYDDLAYSGLMVSMAFDPARPQATKELEFVAGQTTFDPSRSTARAGSLPRRFPLSPTALRQAQQGGEDRAASPADLGFMPVEAAVPTGALGDVWFGLELAMSFGSPGALAPSLGFTGALLLSWAPSAGAANVAVGLRLPGSSGSGRALTIMGPLKLAIGSIDLRGGDATEDYLMRFANVALSFMGLRFPSGGRTNALLFGDPDPAAEASTLGWYVAYAKDRKPDKDEPKELTWPPR